MERILKGTAVTQPPLTVTFGDSIPTDPSPATATVTITNALGAVVVATTAATRTTVGTFTYPLTAVQTAQLDVFTAVWTTTNLGALTTTHEIVGGFLFTIAEARQLEPLEDATKYTVAEITAARTLAEQAYEDVCGVALVPRYGIETLDGSGGPSLFLARPRVTAIRSATVDGVAYTVGQLDGLVARPSGLLVNTAGSWPLGSGNVVLHYEHGFAVPPERDRHAVRLLAKSWLVAGPIDDRTTSFSSEDGTFSLATPGLRGSEFGIPEVDQAVKNRNMRVGVA